MSPGTSSFDGTTSIFSFLITFDAWSLSFCNASKDFSALLSCATPIIAFTITTIKIIIVSVIPSPCNTPTIPETIAAIINTIIEKSLNCSKNLWIIDFFAICCNSLKPYFSCLSSAFSLLSPFSKSVSSSFSTSLNVLLNQFLFSMKVPPFFIFYQILCFIRFCLILKRDF